MSIVFFYLFMPGEPMIVNFSFCENNFRIKICISTIFKGDLLSSSFKQLLCQNSQAVFAATGIDLFKECLFSFCLLNWYLSYYLLRYLILLMSSIKLTFIVLPMYHSVVHFNI